MSALSAVSWGADRIDLFWTERHEVWHRRFDGSTWSDAESLGGRVGEGGVAVTAWAVDQLEVFAIFGDGELWNRFWDGARWHEWESLGGDLSPNGTPAASSWAADRLDVFGPGRAGSIWHRWWNGERWVDWETL